MVVTVEVQHALDLRNESKGKGGGIQQRAVQSTFDLLRP